MAVVLGLQLKSHFIVKDRIEPLAETDCPLVEDVTFYPEVNGFKLDTAIVVNRHDRQFVSLGDLVSNTDLFVRLSSTGCAPCISNLLNQLHKKKRKNADMEICLLVSNIPQRDLYVNHTQHDKEFCFTRIDNFPLDTLINPDSPYLFRINEDGEVIEHFICQFGDTIKLAEYLGSL